MGSLSSVYGRGRTATSVRELALIALLIALFTVMNLRGGRPATLVRWGGSGLLFLLGIEWTLRGDVSLRKALVAGAVLCLAFGYGLFVTPFAFDVFRHLKYTLVVGLFAAAGLGAAVLTLADEERPFRVFLWLNVWWVALNGAVLITELSAGNYYRFSGVYFNPNRLALVTLILCSFLIVNGELYEGWRRYAVALLILCSVALIASTLSIKGMVGLGLVVGAAVIKRASKLQTAAAAALGALALAALLVVPNPLGARIDSFLLLVTAPEQLSHTGSPYERYTFFVAGLEIASRFPFTGVGLQSSPYFNPLRLTYLHSNIVEILVSLGVVGFLLYYIPLLAVLAKLTRDILSSDVDHHELTVYFAVMLAVKLILDLVVVTYPLFEFNFLVALIAYGSLRSFDTAPEFDASADADTDGDGDAKVDPLAYGAS